MLASPSRGALRQAGPEMAAIYSLRDGGSPIGTARWHSPLPPAAAGEAAAGRTDGGSPVPHIDVDREPPVDDPRSRIAMHEFAESRRATHGGGGGSGSSWAEQVWLTGQDSRRRGCHSAALTSPFSRRSNRAGAGAPAT